jgi:hypothetical protein
VRQPMPAGGPGDQGIGLDACPLELAHHPHVEPARTGVFVLKGLGLSRARQSGARYLDATLAV